LLPAVAGVTESLPPEVVVVVVGGAGVAPAATSDTIIEADDGRGAVATLPDGALVTTGATSARLASTPPGDVNELTELRPVIQYHCFLMSKWREIR
jgi:hypothetical protein